MQYNLKNINFKNIPSFLSNLNNFCLWSYSKKKTDSTEKSLKLPYGINKNSKGVIKSLKNKDYWVSMEFLASFLPVFPLKNEFGLGFVLKDTSIVAIDLDNCYENGEIIRDAKILMNSLSEAYIEKSPSGTGLHIWLNFEGEFPSSRNKSNIKLCNTKNKPVGSIEVYSGRDMRYVTLTGDQLYSDLTNSSIIFTKDHLGIKKLLKYFPEDNKSSNLVKINDDESNERIISRYKEEIIRRILNHEKSYIFDKLTAVVKEKNESENDWGFLYFVAGFLDKNNSLNKRVLKVILKEYRYRNKIKRSDYVEMTVSKLFNCVQLKNKIGIYVSQYILEKQNKIIVNKNEPSIIKTCNLMYFFNMDASKRGEFTFSTNEDNKMTFYVPQALDCHDLDFFIAILKEFNEFDEFKTVCIDELLQEKFISKSINVKKLAEHMNISYGGDFYKRLFKSLDKLSKVTIKYHKKLSSNGTVYTGTRFLLSYSREKKVNKASTTKILLNTFTSSTLYQATYNYALIDTKGRNKLLNSQVRYIYTYLCLKVKPGSKTIVSIHISTLLKLWGLTTNQNTLKKRKYRLVSLINEIINNRNNLEDFSLIKLSKDKKYLMVKREKR